MADSWLGQLLMGSGVGPSIIYLALSIAAGMFLGKFKVRGISLGITWVLFVGLALSACGVSLNGEMLHVVKELGLILFVTAVGMQVGPNFFSSFKKGGLALNLLTLANVALGVGMVCLVSALSGERMLDMTGVYTGAVTNTPALSAGQQTVDDLGLSASVSLASGYAVAYPMAVVGLIMTCIMLKPRKGAETAMADAYKPATPVVRQRGIKLIPIFVLIAIGILLGSVPVPVGLAAPIKLGLAGGPLVAALVGSWLAVRKGWLTLEYTASEGVSMLREVGITLFLAAVGLGAGADFVSTLRGGAWLWIFYGLAITVVPPVITGLVGRFVLKVDHPTLMGFIAGSHTDPPALAFANTEAPDGRPNMGYATVYPLTMFLRILTAQLLILLSV